MKSEPLETYNSVLRSEIKEDFEIFHFGPTPLESMKKVLHTLDLELATPEALIYMAVSLDKDNSFFQKSGLVKTNFFYNLPDPGQMIVSHYHPSLHPDLWKDATKPSRLPSYYLFHIPSNINIPLNLEIQVQEGSAKIFEMDVDAVFVEWDKLHENELISFILGDNKNLIQQFGRKMQNTNAGKNSPTLKLYLEKPLRKPYFQKMKIDLAVGMINWFYINEEKQTNFFAMPKDFKLPTNVVLPNTQTEEFQSLLDEYGLTINDAQQIFAQRKQNLESLAKSPGFPGGA